MDAESSDEEEDDTDDPVSLDAIEFNQDEIIDKCRFDKDTFIPPSDLEGTNVFEDNQNDTNVATSSQQSRHYFRDNTTPTNFRTFLDIIRGATGGFSTYFDNVENNTTNLQQSDSVTIKGVADELANDTGESLTGSNTSHTK